MSDLGNQFLTNVPDEDKPILEKYIKEWDGNVTRKFQEYSDKVKQYEDLGDLSDLTNAYQVLNDLRTDPVGFYEYFRSYLVENQESIVETYGVEDLAARLGVQMENNEGGDSINSSPEAEKISALENTITGLEDKLNKFEGDRKEQEQSAMLDSVLEKMHTEHGDFDDVFVLSHIAGGKTPEEAVQAFQNIKQSIIDSHSENPPDILTGPAGTPLDQVDLAKLKNPADRKKIGAAILERSLKS